MLYTNRKEPRLFFDIETRALPQACALMPEPKAPANLKDPEKIAAAIAEKKAEQLSTAALDADYGQIVSIGYAICFSNEPTQAPVTVLLNTGEPGETETDLIITFWKHFAACGGRCVGYNILNFDLPYILRRSFALGIRPPSIPNLAKFRTDPITDLMAILYNWGNDRYKGLKTVVKLYGIPNDCPEVDGSQVATLSVDDLLKYQASDVRLVMALYDRMNGVYFNH